MLMEHWQQAAGQHCGYSERSGQSGRALARRGQAVAQAERRTWGEIAQEELARLGLLDSSTVQEEQRGLLDGMQYEQRTAFAASVAERLLGAHEALPAERQKPYTLGWRPLLDSIWRALAGNYQEFYEISAALARFYLSPQHHCEGQDGPDEANDDAVMATYYAAECFLHGCTDFAIWASISGTEAAFRLAEHDEAWLAQRPAGMSEFGWQLAHPAHQAELTRQLADLRLLGGRSQALTEPLSSYDVGLLKDFERLTRDSADVERLLEAAARIQPARAELVRRLRTGLAVGSGEERAMDR
jgi:hypothetical protein